MFYRFAKVISSKWSTRLYWALSLAGVLLLPVAAAAQPLQGLYVSAGAGASFTPPPEASHDFTKIYAAPGPVGLAAVGWGFGNGLRVEMEGSYRSNEVEGISTLRGNGELQPLTGVGGSVQTFAVMANVLYEVPLRLLGVPLQPYVGAGAGYAWLDLGGASGNGFGTFSLPLNNTVTEATHVTFGTAGAFGYQAIVGAAMPLNVLPGLALTLEYRFFGTTEADVPVNRTGADAGDLVNGTLPHSSTHDDFVLHDQVLLVGLRYSFGAASPAPARASVPAAAPAPAVIPARSYLVFFDWDKATLSERARQIIAEAAAGSTRVRYTRIMVNGYTDTSGSPRYNQGLSVRRAQAVAAELVKDGVSQSAISIRGFGETHLLVPTAPGVREPQNRRVEIIIS